MGKIRRKFDADFKRQIIEEIERGDASMSAICRKYQLSFGLVAGWREKLAKGNLIDKPTSREMELERENEKLKAKIGDLVMQNDLLKKFQSYVQQKKKLDTSVVTPSNLAQLRERAK